MCSMNLSYSYRFIQRHFTRTFSIGIVGGLCAINRAYPRTCLYTTLQVVIYMTFTKPFARGETYVHTSAHAHTHTHTLKSTRNLYTRHASTRNRSILLFPGFRTQIGTARLVLETYFQYAVETPSFCPYVVTACTRWKA